MSSPSGPFNKASKIAKGSAYVAAIVLPMAGNALINNTLFNEPSLLKAGMDLVPLAASVSTMWHMLRGKSMPSIRGMRDVNQIIMVAAGIRLLLDPGIVNTAANLCLAGFADGIRSYLDEKITAHDREQANVSRTLRPYRP